MITLAVQRHNHQYDAMGRPYILHCMKVMHYLRADGDPELQCIGLGHDLKEDGGVTSDDLRNWGFSERIISGITALTKLPGTSEYQQLSQIIGSEDGAVPANLDACKVKLCDLRHNSDIRRSKGLREKDFVRLQKYHRWYAAIQSRLEGTDLWKDILISLRPKVKDVSETIVPPVSVLDKNGIIVCNKCGKDWVKEGCGYSTLDQRLLYCPNIPKAQ